jgi:hypothetical protein
MFSGYAVAEIFKSIGKVFSVPSMLFLFYASFFIASVEASFILTQERAYAEQEFPFY